MIFERVKSAGIAHNSYIVGSAGEIAVIDPRRDCDVYIDYARQKGLSIRHILETHRNEDYVIGSLELAAVTGSEIYHGPGLPWGYGHTLRGSELFRMGKIELTAIHTPGHTDESMSFALTDRATGGAMIMVFTGDALFVGDVGRIDLYGAEEAPRLAADLYESLVKRILPLGDEVIVCPAHGGGSVCGLSIADRDESTLGIERTQNPALQLGGRDAFVRYKLAEKQERPPYFRQMEVYNLEGPPLLGHVPHPASLSPADFRAEMERGALVVDTSEPSAFGGAHIEGAYSIWLEGLTTFPGWVLPYDRPILLIGGDRSHIEPAVRYLIRTGYDRIAGYLRGGTEGWYNAGYPINHLPQLSVHGLKGMLDSREDVVVLDVRGKDEWDTGHIEGAVHIYVGHLEERLAEVPRDRRVAVICNVGRRASLAASILLREGYREIHNVLGSMKAWTKAGFPVTVE